jgi:hypothetical protein
MPVHVDTVPKRSVIGADREHAHKVLGLDLRNVTSALRIQRFPIRSREGLNAGVLYINPFAATQSAIVVFQDVLFSW